MRTLHFFTVFTVTKRRSLLTPTFVAWANRPQKSKLYFRESDSTTEMFDKAERLHDMILAGEPGGGENVSDFSISESTRSTMSRCSQYCVCSEVPQLL